MFISYKRLHTGIHFPSTKIFDNSILKTYLHLALGSKGLSGYPLHLCPLYKGRSSQDLLEVDEALLLNTSLPLH